MRRGLFVGAAFIRRHLGTVIFDGRRLIEAQRQYRDQRLSEIRFDTHFIDQVGLAIGNIARLAARQQIGLAVHNGMFTVGIGSLNHKPMFGTARQQNRADQNQSKSLLQDIALLHMSPVLLDLGASNFGRPWHFIAEMPDNRNGGFLPVLRRYRVRFKTDNPQIRGRVSQLEQKVEQSTQKLTRVKSEIDRLIAGK